jgi:hypothetical protein
MALKFNPYPPHIMIGRGGASGRFWRKAVIHAPHPPPSPLPTAAIRPTLTSAQVGAGVLFGRAKGRASSHVCERFHCFR